MPLPKRPTRKKPIPISEDILPDIDDIFTVSQSPKKDTIGLPAMSPEAVKAGLAGRIKTISDLRRYVPEVADFDVDNLNGMAVKFLSSSLRTPLDEKEIARLRAEREQRLKQQEEDYLKEQQEISEKYGDEGLSNGV